MNPVHSKIPVLIHRGKPICESLIIIHYIDEVWAHKSPALPSLPFQRSHARFWADYIDNKSFGFIDIVFISFYGFFYTFQELGNFNLEAECPKIVHWTQRCLQRESVSKSVVDQHEVFKRVMEMKGKF
ncbi:Probable glutathione S-transferase parC [Linum perenne]